MRKINVKTAGGWGGGNNGHCTLKAATYCLGSSEERCHFWRVNRSRPPRWASASTHSLRGSSEHEVWKSTSDYANPQRVHPGPGGDGAGTGAGAGLIGVLFVLWHREQEGHLQAWNFLLVMAWDVISSVGDRDEIRLKWSTHKSLFWTASPKPGRRRKNCKLHPRGDRKHLFSRKETAISIDADCQHFSKSSPAKLFPGVGEAW